MSGRDIWRFPDGGDVPDLSALLGARDLEAMFDLSGPAQEAAIAALEAEKLTAEAGARAVAAELKAKGVDFDVERAPRGSLWERARDRWDDLMWSWRDRFVSDAGPERGSVPDNAVFGFELTLARSHPTRDIALDHDEIDAEVEWMVEALSAQISAERGCGPVMARLPDAVMDDLAEQDDCSEEDDMLMQAGDVVAYWPPGDGPALALSVRQEDGGLPIEVRLLAHGAVAHRRLVAAVQRAGGRLD